LTDAGAADKIAAMADSASGDGRTILVTGASGVIGGALLHELDGFELIGLVHSGTLPVERAQTLRGDVTAPKLGLSDDEYADLVARTDLIVHSAGLVTFGLPEERYWDINVHGTEHVLELAAAAEVPVHHVGTAFVQSFSPDAPLKLERSNAVWGYVNSKVESDRLFRESGIAHTVFRPPNLIGDSRTGQMSRKQFVIEIAFNALRGRFPFLPARPGATFDMVPQDLCATAIAAIVRADEFGREWWLTYGDKALSVEELLEVGSRYAADNGLEAKLPRLVDPDDEEALEAELEPLGVAGRAMYKRLLELSDAMSAGGVFPSSLDLLAERYGVVVPDLREAMTRGLEHLGHSSGLVKKEQPVAG
jgi:nucleoside-diphosphate-sugar epimerase